MRIEKLKCLVDIAQTGSISGTAQRLYISQQAVSKNIKHLEQELGVEVLVRTKSGVYLTDAGRIVVDFAQKIIKEEEKLQQQLDLLKINKEEKESYIEIWSTSSVTKMVLPDVLAKLQNMGKKISINLIQINDSKSIVEQVLSGENTIGLMTINEEELYKNYPELEGELAWETFVRDEIVMVADSRYYGYNNLKIGTDLEKITQMKTVYNLIPIEEIRQLIYDLHIICSSDADFHRSMMEQTGSITFMSGLDFRYYFNHKRYLALRLDYDMPNIVHGVFYRKDASAELRGFIDGLRRAMQGLKTK